MTLLLLTDCFVPEDAAKPRSGSEGRSERSETDGLETILFGSSTVYSS